MDAPTIGWIDISIIAIYLIFIVWWGLRNGKSSSTREYFLAGRTMPWWIVGLSLFAASISSTTLIGQTGDAYHTGIAVFNYNLMGVVVMIFFITFLLPLYVRSGIFTIPEFLEKRFDKRSRYFFSAICIIGNVFLDAAGALYAAALILKIFFPTVDIWVFVLLFAIIAASYTIPGGLSSAIKAEIIQAVILIVGSIILMGICFAKGGADYISSQLAANDVTMKLIRPLNDPATPWLGLIIGMPITGLYFWANNQTLVQRVLSARNLNEGRKGVILTGFLTLATLFLFALPGVAARGMFPGIEKPDMVYPTLIVQLLPTALLGLMLSALLAALTSTISAILSSTSTLFTMDFYAKFDKKADQKKLVTVGKITSLAIIVLAAIWAPNIGKFGSLLKYYQEMLSYIAPPIVACFLLGIFSKRVNAKGAFTGLVAGLVVAVAMLFVKGRFFPDFHFLYLAPILFALSLVVIYVVSFASGRPSDEKLKDTLWTRESFRQETCQLKGEKWYNNYRTWSVVLLVLCAVLLFLYR